MKTYRRALTIAGSDSSGGAGIQADLKTFSALGCYGMSVLTGLTAQNTQGVRAIHEIPSSFIESQLHAVLDDLGADAVKTGMLGQAEPMERIIACLDKHDLHRLVVDPVIFAKGGGRLISEDAVRALKEILAPRATVLTPNLLEASELCGVPLKTKEDVENAGRYLCDLGPRAVVIKGGFREDGANDDLLAVRGDTGKIKLTWLRRQRVETPNVHGAGCTLAAAITAFLARGLAPEEAIRRGADYLHGALLAGAGYRLGRGHGPVAHFYQWWDL